MTQKQQQRLIGTLLLVLFIAVLAYIVLSKVSQTESGRQKVEEEPIQFFYWLFDLSWQFTQVP